MLQRIMVRIHALTCYNFYRFLHMSLMILIYLNIGKLERMIVSA